MAEDLLFATLDPTMREVRLPGFDKAILSDTVGFVSDLPTELVAAFRATLEEVAAADLILHIRDRSHPDSDAQAADVATVLASLGLDEAELAAAARSVEQDRLHGSTPSATRCSARPHGATMSSPSRRLTGEGVDALRDVISQRLQAGAAHRIRSSSAAGEGERIAWLHARGEVLDQRHDGDTIHVAVKLSPENWERFQRL